eukprot:TRINITY_DN76229_c0_g1_i1.p1 TRINITY_DN76229_c0_g1~~TRINITY_DN76229_c0_g1_i1.p1  ORF type:complete len:261 (+),score=12.39 TRINITY_DN76229_c0_g1_i1:57-785(+)
MATVLVSSRCSAFPARRCAVAATTAAARRPTSAIATPVSTVTRKGTGNDSTAGRRTGWAGAAVAGGALLFWEGRRHYIRSDREEISARYRDTGAESRFPFYGRDSGYEVDYMIELGLDHGDVCQVRYDLARLHASHAAVAALFRWRRSAAAGGGGSDADDVFDEVATVEVNSGRRYCRHPARPTAGAPWRLWWPHSEPTELTPYSDWLAWNGLGEMRVVPLVTPPEGPASAGPPRLANFVVR